MNPIVGQVWVDSDPRMSGRKILIVGIDKSRPFARVLFRPCDWRGVPFRTDNKPRSAKWSRFGRKNNGYMPNKEVSGER